MTVLPDTEPCGVSMLYIIHNLRENEVGISKPSDTLDTLRGDLWPMRESSRV